MSENKKNRFMPLWLSLCVVLGIMIGVFITNHFSGNRLNIINSGSSRLSNLLHVIDDQYVDSVNINELVDKALPQILAELDPHSVYISAKDGENATDDLKGSFSGIGVEFSIINDTLQIQKVTSNGPSEKAGLLGGDKIIAIDGKPFVGKLATNDAAMRQLKGAKGTKVKITVKRYGQKLPLTFTVTRDDIIMNSISAAYMLDDSTGYIKVKGFGERTYGEMLLALQKLNLEGAERLVVDLRDNTGGYLNSAVQMLQEFLKKDQLIVYTKGRKSPREDYKCLGKGSYQQMPLIVLINENSASASEIFAGAVQDNDRGTIIGRRSFGKGFVQHQMQFPDGSLVRLTIARYYTPSGRCIQKPFTPGDNKHYEEDILSRYQHGELFSQDSIKHIGPTYHTANGRTVYGGGGITPDIFIAEDTTNYTSYYKEAVLRGFMYQFTTQYLVTHRQTLSQYTDIQSLSKALKKHNVVGDFVVFAEKNGLRRRNNLIRKSHKLIEDYIKTHIIYNLLGEQASIEFLNQDDPMIRKALEVFRKGQSFPQPPQKKGKTRK